MRLGEPTKILMSQPEPNAFPSQLKIESMCINEKETMVYVITSQGQLIKSELNIREFEKQPTQTCFDYI